MKKERFLEILILLLIAFFLIACAYSAFYYIKIKPNLYSIEFGDAGSIIKGSPVRFMGIIVGHVRNLSRREDKILCEIVITKPNTKIPDGAVAQVEFNGLAGSKSIEIMPPHTDNPGVKGIIAHDSLRINDLMDSMRYVGEVFTIVKDFLEDITPESSLKTVKALSQTPDLDPLNKSLDKIVENQKNTNEKVRKIRDFEKSIESFVDRFTKPRTK